MSDSSKATPAEPEASGNLAQSFADRLTFPSDSKDNTNGTDSSSTPAKFNWADEVTTPVQESDKKPELPATTKSEDAGAQADGAAKSSLEMAQNDGATTWLGGSTGLDEPEFDVNVKLADLQDDPSNPLFSAKTFEELNL